MREQLILDNPKPWNLQHFQCIEAPNPGIYRIFSAAEDHIQESAAYQRYFQGADAHESKPSEEGPSQFFSQESDRVGCSSGHGLLALES